MSRRIASESELGTRVRGLLTKHPLLAGVVPSVVERIASMGTILIFNPGEDMSREGEVADYWLLLSGSARVFYSSPSGFQVTVKLFGAPAAWGEIEVVTGGRYVENCVALDRATVVRLERLVFEQLMGDSPAFMKNVLHDTCARFLIAAQHERALAFMKVPERLAYLLLAYVRLYGVPVDGGIAIRVRLSQTELAQGLGVTLRSVERALQDLKQQKVIAKSGARYVVTDIARLATLTGDSIVGIDWVAGSRVEEGLLVGPRRQR